MKPTGLFIFLVSLLVCCSVSAQPKSAHNLIFDTLAKRWDEGIPLGNGWLGALVWQKDDQLRLSLDRVDLWDDRPMPKIDQLKFSWVVQQVRKGQYDTVQKVGDVTYEENAAPTKLPGAALEFDLGKIGRVVSNVLDLQTALSTIKFGNGAVMHNYIHATRETGYFGFENLSNTNLVPQLVVPNYNTGKAGAAGNSVTGLGLEWLGYAKGSVTQTANSIRYHQPTWQGNFYEVLVKWYPLPGNKLIGQWTITQNKTASLPDPDFSKKEPTGWPAHEQWWKGFWSRSSVSLPDAQLERQYYRELYKFGSVARNNTPPISLQAVWTADNGSLPPWKGDLHHDLNTQLSYWPGYTANHPDLTASFTTWLWAVKAQNQQWTKQYFEVEGLNVPGVTTISGKPMGGWIQYSMSPTTVGWVSQHFYWQWKYSMDETFLKTRAYPYIHAAAVYLENISHLENGVRKLPLSSSPELHNNSIRAWFRDWSNYDLTLAKYLFTIAAEVSKATGRSGEATHWQTVLRQLPGFAVNETGLTVTPTENLNESHRHLSMYMAIHPLALLDANHPENKSIIENSLARIAQMGTREWCGYSFSWMAALYARAYKADSAVRQLQIFASNFCSPNSFHLNGDQRGGEYSNFTYRPFTLEGNFAFAQGVHELLLQSRNGYVQLFPAVPDGWRNVSFTDLRSEGAFLFSAKMENGVPVNVKIKSEKGGVLKLRLPFISTIAKGKGVQIKREGDLFVIPFQQGQVVELINSRARSEKEASLR